MAEKVYSHAGIDLWLGDCRDVLPLLPDESIDLVLTDPPYGLGRKGASISGGIGSINLDFFASDQEGDRGLAMVVDACRLSTQKIKADGAAYWWCGHKQFGPLEAVLAATGRPTGFLVWRKTYTPPQVRKASWRYVAELCVWAGRPKNFLGQHQMRNVLEYLPMIASTTKSGHPTEKPAALIRHIVQAASNLGNLVLDCFAGSGTTLVAAKQLGRRAIGVEINPAYVEIAIKRLAQEVMPLEEVSRGS